MARFEAMMVIVDPTNHLVGGNIMDYHDCLIAEVIGPAKGLNGDIRVMWGDPSLGIACTFDTYSSNVIPFDYA